MQFRFSKYPLYSFLCFVAVTALSSEGYANAHLSHKTPQVIHGELAEGTTNPKPKIEVYLPENDGRSDIAVIILPGGGYGALAAHEGEGYARFFQKNGIASFVVEYRLGKNGHRHPSMIEDALAAIQTVRKRAEEFEVNPEKVGVMGSSAGGHLTAHTVTSYGEYSEELRPDFGVLCYPVIEMYGAYTHKGSRRNLLGENPSRDLIMSVSPDLKVSAETPPCFLWHTVEDPVVPVENSLLFASALQKNGVPFELHVYPNGRHGLGMNADFPWEDSLLRWLND